MSELSAEHAPVVDATREGVERWMVVSARLELTRPAQAVGAVLIAEMIRGLTTKTRDVHSWVTSELSFGRALAGLAELEERNAVTVDDERLRMHPRLFIACLGEASVAPPGVAPPVPARVARALAQAVRGATTGSVLLVLRGQLGSGRDAAAAAVAATLERPLVYRSANDRGALDAFEPALSDGIAVLDERGCEGHGEDRSRGESWLARSRGIAIAIVDADASVPSCRERLTVLVELDPIDRDECRETWSLGAGQQYAQLGDRSRAGLGLVRRARQLAELRGGLNEASLREALEVCADPARVKGVVAEHPGVPLARVVTSDRVREAIERALLLMRRGSELPDGRLGAKVLFSGPSGTGKTLAARALATELGRPLYRVDIATVVSKWIGETEKNLRGAFAAAEATGAVLLFDEGDALFGRRGEVSRGTDRYANMEVSYLLQAMESFAGSLIVTTNARGNIDAAFERRFDVIADFPLPDAPLRALVWQQELGPAWGGLTPRLLSRLGTAELSGGSIASAARMAQALAIDDAALRDEHVIRAMRAEFQKAGLLSYANEWVIENGAKS